MTAHARPEAPGAPADHDDYSLLRVPESERYSWWSVATQRFGQLSALAQFLLGATLGLGMTFWHAVLAITLGSVLLEIVTIFIGVIGVREGLSTSVLARWTGFGAKGSALIGLTVAVSLIGWFGVQNAVFAEGLHSLIGGLPVEAWSLIGGLAVTAVVVYGFKGMAWAAYVTVPAFLVLATWSIGRELSRHSLGDLVSSPPAGEPMSLAAGATLVAGGFIVGAVMTPDMTRYNRSVGDVVKQTLVGHQLPGRRFRRIHPARQARAGAPQPPGGRARAVRRGDHAQPGHRRLTPAAGRPAPHGRHARPARTNLRRIHAHRHRRRRHQHRRRPDGP